MHASALTHSRQSNGLATQCCDVVEQLGWEGVRAQMGLTGRRMFCTTERYCCSLMKPSNGEKALHAHDRQYGNSTTAVGPH